MYLFICFIVQFSSNESKTLFYPLIHFLLFLHFFLTRRPYIDGPRGPVSAIFSYTALFRTSVKNLASVAHPSHSFLLSSNI